MTQNNILSKVSELCDGKKTCKFPASISIFGNDFSECSKDIELSWRCFSYDKLHSLTAGGGKTVFIDCTKQ